MLPTLPGYFRQADCTSLYTQLSFPQSSVPMWISASLFLETEVTVMNKYAHIDSFSPLIQKRASAWVSIFGDIPTSLKLQQ